MFLRWIFSIIAFNEWSSFRHHSHSKKCIQADSIFTISVKLTFYEECFFRSKILPMYSMKEKRESSSLHLVVFQYFKLIRCAQTATRFWWPLRVIRCYLVHLPFITKHFGIFHTIFQTLYRTKNWNHIFSAFSFFRVLKNFSHFLMWIIV